MSLAYPWLTKTADLARYLVQYKGPITFFLGAGASISSGAPTTAQVQGAFANATSGRVSNPDELRTYFHRITSHEKLLQVQPLFADVHPYLGYRCLTAMAHTRKIVVATLNWDTAIEQACKVQGVPCHSFDLEKGRDEIASASDALQNQSYGLVCIHLHGCLLESGNIRFGTLETLRFDAPERDLLKSRVFCNPSIFVGASLRGDTDVTNLLAEMAEDAELTTTAVKPIWMLSREPRTLQDDSPSLGVLRKYVSDLNLVQDESVDFDQLLLQVQAFQRNTSFDQLVATQPQLALERFDTVVFPRPLLMRPHLDGRVIVFVGEPNLGKTTVAHLTAYWMQLSCPEGLQVRSFERPSNCIRALVILLEHADTDLLVLEEPFGSSANEFDPNPMFFDELERVVSSPGAPRVIITTCISNWERAIEGRRLDPAIKIVSSAPADWYDTWSLLKLIQGPESIKTKSIQEAIKAGIANTPQRIRAALRSNTHGDIEAEARGDKRALLRRTPERAIALGLVRLQQLSNDPKPLDYLFAAIGVPDWHELLPQMQGMLHTYALDTLVFGRLAHPTDTEAIDELLQEPQSFLWKRLNTLAEEHTWLRDALDVWAALAGVRAGNIVPVSHLHSSLIGEWAPAILAAASNSGDVLPYLSIDKLDFWSLCDLVYEVVRLWPTLRSSLHAQTFLSTVLSERNRMGTYAVLEACLFLQHAAHAEIWDRLEAHLWDVLSNCDTDPFEAALVFDGLCWRPAPGINVREWLERLSESAPSSTSQAGAFAFVGLYHPNTANLVQPGELNDLTELLPVMTSDQATQFNRMMIWHFLHQSRKRAIIHRREFGSHNIECLRRGLHHKHIPEGHTGKLHSTFRRLAELSEHAGWGFHLGINLCNKSWAGNSIELLKLLLSRCAPRDPGVISAAMTYEIPPPLVVSLQQYFSVPENRNALLDAFSKGIEVDGTYARPPRFLYARDPYRLQKLLGMHWPRLEQMQLAPIDDPSFVENLRSRAEAASRTYAIQPEFVNHVLKLVQLGDLRCLEEATPARGIVTDPYLHVLVAAASAAQAVTSQTPSLFDEEGNV